MVKNEFEKIVESRSLLKEDQIKDIQNKIDYLFWLEEEKEKLWIMWYHSLFRLIKEFKLLYFKI